MKVTWTEGELRPGIYLIPRGSVLCPSWNGDTVLLGKLESRWRKGLEKRKEKKKKKKEYPLFLFLKTHKLWFDIIDYIFPSRYLGKY